MKIEEILEKVQMIQDQIREDNTAGALDSLNKLEDELTIAVEKPQPMTAKEEDKNAGIVRDEQGKVMPETTGDKRNDFGLPVVDARDHHLINKDPKRIIG